MHISHLLQEAKTPEITAYHATSANNLRQILKTGLVPNRSKGGYGEGEKSEGGYSTDALPGTYFYKDYRDAEDLGKSLSAKNDSDTLIAICRVQPKTAELDEDRLNSSHLLDDKRVIKQIKQGADPGDVYRDSVMDLSMGLHKMGIDDRMMNNVKPAVSGYVKSLVNYAQSPTPEAEAQLRKFKNDLTIKLKKLVISDGSRQHSFKINEPIGFSGANRIVGLYLLGKGVGWGQLGGFERDAYHVYDSPQKLFS